MQAVDLDGKEIFLLLTKFFDPGFLVEFLDGGGGAQGGEGVGGGY